MLFEWFNTNFEQIKVTDKGRKITGAFSIVVGAQTFERPFTINLKFISFTPNSDETMTKAEIETLVKEVERRMEDKLQLEVQILRRQHEGRQTNMERDIRQLQQTYNSFVSSNAEFQRAITSDITKAKQDIRELRNQMNQSAAVPDQTGKIQELESDFTSMREQIDLLEINVN